ncbi:hypothetical protein Tco_0494779 [Tanacetum coccineum]
MISILVTPRASALAGCDRLVSEPLVIEKLDIRLLFYSIVRNPWNSLIPLSRGSFDVIVGMDRLSKRKFMIVCHEKVVRIPLEGYEMLWVHGKRTQGVVKTLMNTKRQVEFRIDLVHGATPVAKSPYRLAPLEMQELRGAWSSIEVSVGITEEGKVVPLVGSEMDEAHASSMRYLSENEIESPWILSLNFQGQSSEYDVIWAMVVLIKEKLKTARDRQKSYADNRRKLLEFEVRDRVLLKVSPSKGVICFGKRGKLAPIYVGPFKIFERIDLVAYRLRLPEELSSVHDTFYVSNLKKCLADANLHVPLNEIKIDKTLRFV